jgi:hypothetical protein
MSNEHTPLEPFPPAAQSDWFLQRLASFANEHGLEIGITLQVSGLLVSGILVSGARYFEAIAENFSHGLTSHADLARVMKEGVASFAEVYARDTGATTPPLPQYLHLKEAQFFSTSGVPVPENQRVWWRGRVSEVGGFTVGQLQRPGI